jgi:hypothetical protein
VLDYWHLLSLDAPSVAFLWTCAFAWSVHAHVPWLSSAMLALATWLLYVADRLLDGLPTSKRAVLQQRHLFHFRYRFRFVSAAIPVAIPLTWFVLTRMNPVARRDDIVLGGCALLYLLCVHLPISNKARFVVFPKELAVGAIFAAACVIPAWSREPAGRPMLVVPAILFGALCWLNCVAIEHWEQSDLVYERLKVDSTHWIGEHLRAACLLLFIVSAGAVFFPGPGQILSLAVGFSALLTLWLHQTRRRLSPLRLRAAADAVLLSPMLLLPGVKVAGPLLQCFFYGHSQHVR